MGTGTGTSRLLYTLARCYWGAGDRDRSRMAYEESLALSEEAGDKLGIRGAHEGLGHSLTSRVISKSAAPSSPRSWRRAATWASRLCSAPANSAPRRRRRPPRADWLRQALSVAQDVGDGELVGEIESDLSQITH